MKSQISLYLLGVVLFSFLACTKELSKETGNGTGTGNSSFYATISGVQWNADSLQLVQVSNTGVTISGLSKSGEEISMILPSFKTGTYNLNAQSVSYALYANLLGTLTNVYVSNAGTAAGTITISSIDTVNKTISGIFQFYLVNPSDNSTVNITNGVFTNIPYIGGTNLPGGITDTLQATIDGSSFFGAQVLDTIMNGQLLIGGISANGTSSVELIMPANITPGSYNMDFATGIYIGVYNPSASVTLVSQANGTLTILSNNTVSKRITGSFSFIASALTGSTTSNITQGYFSLNY